MTDKELKIKEAYELVWLTSGQAMIYDKVGNQIGDLQIEFASGKGDRSLLTKIVDNCEKFTVAYFREWHHRLTKEEFKSFLLLN